VTSERGRRAAGSRAAGLALLALSVFFLAGCAAKRYLGFGPDRDGILIVRHSEPVPQSITVDGDEVGVADSGKVTCFAKLRTGTVRVEARPVERPDRLTRAASVVLAPEQPQLWDVDHDQVLDGRAYAGACGA